MRKISLMAKVEKKDGDREYRKFILSWLPKYGERIQMILLNIKDKREINEDDMEVMRTAFRSYYMGYCPDFVPAWQPHDKSSAKQLSITDNSDNTIAENQGGLIFDTIPTEPNIVIENEKV